MLSFIPRLSGTLFLATALTMFSLPAQALTINFSPDTDLDTNSGAYSALVINFGAAIRSVFADQPIGTPNSAWITSGGAINIGAGQQISATITIDTGSNGTSSPLTAVFEDSAGTLSSEQVLAGPFSTGSSQIFNLLLPFAGQASDYNLFFGLKFFSTDGIGISSVSLDLELTEAPPTAVNAPGVMALLGQTLIGAGLARRQRRGRGWGA
jgi:hypothetical protein